MALSTMWDWKVEPESPGFAGVDPSEDVWLFDDHDVNEVTIGIDEDEKLGQPTTKAEVTSELLDDLNEWIKEEPFNDWLEEKIDLPIFEELPPLDQRNKYKSLDTQTLLQEFETVFGEVGFNNGALTPPQSPPHPPFVPTCPPEPETMVFHQLAVPEKVQNDNLMHLYQENIPEKMTYSIDNTGEVILLQTLSVPKVYQPVSEESVMSMENTSALDELVRSRAADIDTSSDPWETSTTSSPRNDSSESDYALSPPESGSENSNFGMESSEDPEWVDPEWVPAPVNAKVAAPPKRKRSKPYARPVEDKKLRKKEQNKNAATRYRQKKKAEVDVVMEEEKGLLEKNTELLTNVEEISREIKYLKGLMRDLFKAKGLLK